LLGNIGGIVGIATILAVLLQNQIGRGLQSIAAYAVEIRNNFTHNLRLQNAQNEAQ